MGEYLRWVELHSQALLVVGLSIFGLGVLLSLMARSRRRAIGPTQNRSVRVGRDNTGTIITGDVGRLGDPSGDLLSKVGNWASIIGLLVSIISTIPLVHSWF
jgi:hypothetical protein